MSALQTLQEKITQWKNDHEALKGENEALKSQLENAAGIEEAKEVLNRELEAKVTQCQSHEETITSLQSELREKDAEIEKIIAQVEALLS